MLITDQDVKLVEACLERVFGEHAPVVELVRHEGDWADEYINLEYAVLSPVCDERKTFGGTRKVTRWVPAAVHQSFSRDTPPEMELEELSMPTSLSIALHHVVDVIAKERLEHALESLTIGDGG